MKKQRELWFCEICGNLVEALYAQGPNIVCCGEEMKKLEPKTEDTSVEKHVPYVENKNGGVQVRIGEKENHPMTDKHYIVFIQVHTADKVCRHELKPGDAPSAWFPVAKKDITGVYEWCNVHGLWKK